MDLNKAFHALQTHAWYRTLYNRLSKADLALADDFIKRHMDCHDNLTKVAINRMGLEYPNKNIGLLQDLLLAAVTNCKKVEVKNEQLSANNRGR